MHPTTKLLQDERAQVSFPLMELQKLLYTPRSLELIQKSQDTFDKIREFKNNPDYFNKNRKEKIMNQADKLKTLRTYIQLDNLDDWLAPISYSQSQAFTAVFYGMVVQAVRILGSEEQVQRWDQDFLSTRIIACYAQTELGGGSDVQNLKTTATFDQTKDEFVINTPCIEATKFWPGELGFLSNWALVYAQLMIDGKNHGIHPFMVPIRDVDTHKTLAGVTVGDIGPKLGYDTKDNGFLSFQHVRIPRSNLLQGFYKLSRDGKLTKQGNEKISYSSMMLIRKALIFFGPRIAAQALTVAIRYSITRQQFKNDQKIENKVLDYQSQQDKLLPQLAKLYAVIFGGLWLKQLVEDNFERVQRKDFSNFQLTHALLSGSKANYTYFVNDCCEWSRLSCGGHGYAHYSGLPAMFFDQTANVTLEGENKVMYLQLARYIMKVLQYAQKTPDRVPQEFDFLKNITETLTTLNIAKSEKDLISLGSLEQFLQQNTAAAISNCVKLLKTLASQGVSSKEAWDYHANDHLIDAAAAFMEYFNFRIFVQTIEKVTVESIKSGLTQLAQLYGVHQIISNCGFLIDESLINAEQIKVLKKAKETLLVIIRKDAIGYVEAFGYSDNHLKSLIGRQDGKPYETILEWTKNENVLNKVNVKNGILELKQVKPML